MPRDLRRFVEESLRVLAREAPASYAAFCATLRGRHMRVSGDGEPFTLQVESSVASAPPDGSEDLHLGVDRRTIFALVDGALTLEDALRHERLTLRGHIRNVVDLFDGLAVYLRGAVRCPSFPPLLSDFRLSSEDVLREVPHEPEQAPAFL